MLRRAITGFLGTAFILTHASAFAANGQQSKKAAKSSDLTISCAKECPGATSNDDAMKCAEKMEKTQGEVAFKKQHGACYSAHEKYEKQSGQEEAGEAAEESHNE